MALAGGDWRAPDPAYSPQSRGGRYSAKIKAGTLVTTPRPGHASSLAASASGIFAARVGANRRLGRRGARLRASLADLRAAHEGFFPKLMGSELTPEF